MRYVGVLLLTLTSILLRLVTLSQIRSIVLMRKYLKQSALFLTGSI